ncbi:hypothetical protein BT93_L0302 [Corymbia citriodora subsp. variegata]|uniref:Uncharacterized protein n=1 Tax=Corymbia citriodora subsp. variegata TaxID=360336 RepID=A0A8T0CQ45_CORYI|nr:hypothetical protein BT93_L0302 [Corymbia citriodora subsp. variegata]
MNNLIAEEVKKDERGPSMEVSEDEMDSSKEEEIWRGRRDRMNNAMAASQAVAGQDPSKTYAAACRLTDVINNADIEEFISEIESFADRIDLFAVLKTMGPCNGSMLNCAASARKDDILRLLIDSVGEHLIDARDEWGNTPLHEVAWCGGSTRAAEMLIRRARDLPNVEDKNRLLRSKNKQGNTALHNAVIKRHADLVRYLLSEDLEPVYWENAFHRSPLYEAILIDDSKLHEVLFSLPLEPSRIEGLPPVHGAIAYSRRGMYFNLLM